MQRSSLSMQGFTLVEVLVSILITTVFVAVAFQGIMAATLLNAKALQQTEAANWILSDLETLRWQTTDPHLPFQPNRCQTSLADQSFADALRDRIAQTDVVGMAPYQVPAQIKQSVTGQKFDLARTLYLMGSGGAHQILGIQYQVQPHDSPSQPILSFYAEVLPDAAFQCP
jgi:prepilin-type N-terminal cleavage/methylation domain-containing protein